MRLKMGDVDRLNELRRTRSRAKVAQVLAVLQANTDSGRPLAVAALARQAKVSRRFIYDHPELRAEVTRHEALTAERSRAGLAASVRMTTASLRADLENAKARNRRLESDLVGLKRRLGEMIGSEAVGDALGLGERDHLELAARIEELDQELFDVRQALAQRSEELEAARQINRELMARLNRVG
jgi:hypothetical protein